MPSISRRSLLRAVAAGGVVGLAGCSSSCPDSDHPEPDQVVGPGDGPAGPLRTTPATEWPSAGYDAANTGYTGRSDVPDTVVPRWQTALSMDAASTPVVAGGRVFLAGQRNVHALDIRTGERLWTDGSLAPTAIDDAFEYRPGTVAPAVGSGVLAVGGTRQLVAFDPATGSERWRYGGATAFGGPTVVDETVYVGSSGGLVAVDVATGEERWRGGTGLSAAASRPAIGAGAVVAVERNETVAVEATTGDQRWRAGVGGEFAPVVADGTVYVGGYEGLTAIDAETGEQRWTYRRGDGREFSSPVVTPDTLYAVERPVEGPRATFALERTDGEPSPRWCSYIGDGAVTAATGDRTFVVGGSSGPGLTAFTAELGEATWEYRGGGGRSQLLPPAVVDGAVVVTDRRGRVTALGAV